MIEIRLHGRGGQGVVTATEILAIASFKEGMQSQAFPKFGPERRNAPVEGYCRIDDKFINMRSQIYEPDYLVVLDDGLLSLGITKGLKKNGIIVINSGEDESYPQIENFKTYFVNATQIAVDILKKPIVNTAVLGAFAKTGLLKLDSILEAVKERMPEKIVDINIEAVKQAYEKTKLCSLNL